MSINQENHPKPCFREFLERAAKWFDYKNKGEWLKDMKGSISLTASIIATMTFSLATNPPGGVLQASLSDPTDCMTRNKRLICVGEAILANRSHVDYLRFLICNTICFIASLSVILVLVSGIPINRGFTIWLLSTGMCITLTTLSLTYMFAANMVTPNSIWSSLPGNVFGIAIMVFASIVIIVFTFLLVRLFVRGANKYYK